MHAAGKTAGDVLHGTREHGFTIEITDAEKRRLNELMADPYIAYCIVTKVERRALGLDPGEYAAWRRYSEFEMLHDYLQQKFPASVIPPIPPKRGHASIAKIVDNFDPEFIERRRQALESFLRRCGLHDAISADEAFSNFLQADVWVRRRARGVLRVPATGRKGAR